jgi:hypothetical protein
MTLYGITTNGTAVPNGGLDGSGYTYSANLLGSSLAWNGSTFTFGAADSADAASSKTIALPAGNYSTLNLLGSGVSGNQPNQTFTVTYSDGTTSTFTQSLSDWFNPQGYTGESIVATMGYRVSITGATSPGPVYLYGYSFALNSAKSVSSLTLPNNIDVAVLAIDLTPAPKATPTAATPTFSPAAGSYSTSTVSVSLADSTPGATIYYTLDGSTPTTSSAKYSAALTLSASTTVQAIAVASGYNNSAVASATYTISSSGGSSGGGGSGTTVSVSLSGADNLYGITTNGTAVPNGGLDGSGYTYSANLLGTSIVWGGSTFTLGAAGTANAVTSKTITLPAGNYGSLNLLATAVNGPQVNQPFVVTYTDGSSTTFTQSLSDWGTPLGLCRRIDRADDGLPHFGRRHARHPVRGTCTAIPLRSTAPRALPVSRCRITAMSSCSRSAWPDSCSSHHGQHSRGSDIQPDSRGNYSVPAQTVTPVGCTPPALTIYYTTNGTTPSDQLDEATAQRLSASARTPRSRRSRSASGYNNSPPTSAPTRSTRGASDVQAGSRQLWQQRRRSALADGDDGRGRSTTPSMARRPPASQIGKIQRAADRSLRQHHDPGDRGGQRLCQQRGGRRDLHHQCGERRPSVRRREASARRR